MSAYAYENLMNAKSYARTLYANYRARMLSAGQHVPLWENASPVVRREFVEEAKQLLN